MKWFKRKIKERKERKLTIKKSKELSTNNFQWIKTDKSLFWK
jgi:hypothetical protein